MVRRNSPFNGWQVLDGLTVIAFIPYSESFKFNGVDLMATTDAEAESLAGTMINSAEETGAFLKS